MPQPSYPPHTCAAAQGRDHTIFSLVEGRVKFSRDPRTKRRFVMVEPMERPQQAQQAQRAVQQVAEAAA